MKEQRFCYGGGEEEHGKQNFEAAVGTFGHKQHGGCPEQGWVSFLTRIYGKYPMWENKVSETIVWNFALQRGWMHI